MKSLQMTAIAGAVAAAALLAPSLAEASTGYTKSSVNLRTGPGTRYHVIMTVPGGARVDVGRCSTWCQITYHRRGGYVLASRLARAGFEVRPPAPTFGYRDHPRWDERHHAWYDGHRWYYQGRWYDQPNFSITFGFGG